MRAEGVHRFQRHDSRRWVVLCALVLLLASSVRREARAIDWQMDINLGGGSALLWDDLGEIGHMYGGSLGITFDRRVRVALVASGVLPASRMQGHFGAFWLEGQYHPIDPWYWLSPYVIFGAGFATPDDLGHLGEGHEASIRWSTALDFLGTLGLGLSYGAETGLYVAFEVRALNLTHGAISLVAGYRF